MNKIMDWFRFDVHSHSSEDKKTSRSINLNMVFDKYIENNVKLVAITDHNRISKTSVDYLNKLAKEKEKDFIALNGSELDIFFNKDYDRFFQVLAIFPKSKVKSFNNWISQFYNKNGEFNDRKTKRPNIEDLKALHKTHNPILIPHFINKQPERAFSPKFLNEEQTKYWDKIFNMFKMLECKPNDKLNMKMWEENYDKKSRILDQPLVYFTDNKKTSEYTSEQLKKLPQMRTELSYEGLEYACFLPNARINYKNKHLETSIIKIKKMKYTHKEYKTDKNTNEKVINNIEKEIDFSFGLNTIIGEMGSGKSILLDSLSMSLNGGKDISNKRKKFIEDEQEISFITQNDIEISVNSPDSNIKAYIMSQNKLSELTSAFHLNRIEDFLEDNQKIKFKNFQNKSFSIEAIKENLFNSWNFVELKINSLKKNLYSYYKNYLNELKNKEIENQSSYINHLIQSYEDKISEIRNKILVKNNKINNNLLKFIIKINNFVNDDIFNHVDGKYKASVDEILKDAKEEFLGDIDIYGNNTIVNKMLNPYVNFIRNFKAEMIGQYKALEQNKKIISIEKLIVNNCKEINNNLKKINDNLKEIDSKIITSKIKQEEVFNIKEVYSKYISIEGFNKLDDKIDILEILNVYFKIESVEKIKNLSITEQIKKRRNIKEIKYSNSKNMYINGQNIDELSPGQRQESVIKKILNDNDKEIIIIDQPEDNMDPGTIAKSMINEIINISTKKQLIIVTHDPKVVINANANNIIIAKKEDGFIHFENKQINSSNLKNTSIAKIIDGNKEFVHKRSAIYKSDSERIENE